MSLALLLVATVPPLLLLLACWRKPESVGRRDARLALRFAVCFGLLCAPALPHGTDFWGYLAQGRLAVTGADVYVQKTTPSFMVDLPAGRAPQNVPMVYGPAWVWLNLLLSRLAGSRLVVEFVLYKGLFLVAWVVTLLLVSRSLSESPRHQVAAVLITGWLPVSVIQTVAEGHNDIVMVALLTGWLVSRRPSGGWLLVGSVLIKYVTAPIVAIAAVDALIRRSMKTGVVLAAASLVAAVVLVSLWNDGALIAGLRVAVGYRRFSPAAIAGWVFERASLSPFVAASVVFVWRVLILGFVGWYGWRHFQRRSSASLCAWVTAAILGILLSADSVWPWYTVWVLPALALAFDRVLLGLALPLIVLMPFLQILYIWGYLSPGRATALMYAAVGMCWLVTFIRAKRTP